MPLLVLLLAFIIVPLVELAVIGQVSARLGLPLTLALLLLDSVVGAVLVKREGRRAWLAFRAALSEARWPGDEVVQGALVLVGGALLVTPGFVTDAVGLAAVIPPTRRLLSRLLRTRLTPAPLRPLVTDRRPGRDRAVRRGSGPRDEDVLDVEVVSVERDGPEDGATGSSGAPQEPKG